MIRIGLSYCTQHPKSMGYNVGFDIFRSDGMFESLLAGDHRLFRVALEIPVGGHPGEKFSQSLPIIDSQLPPP